MGSWAHHVNALGQVSGEATWDGTNYYGVFWRKPDEPIAFASHDGGWASARASNSAGQVVGANHQGKMLLWTVAPVPTTPAEHVSAIDASVTSLVESGGVSANDAKALTAVLDAVSGSLQKSNAAAARNQLQALSNQVRAMEKSGRISSSSAASLQAQISNATTTLK